MRGNLKRLVFGVLIAVVFAFTADAQNFPSLMPKEGLKDFKKKAPIIVNGDSVEYLQDQKKIHATGHVKVSYGDVTLVCKEITVFTETQSAMCEGDVTITQPGNVFTGERIEYNFAEKTGTIVKGRVKAAPIYGGADRVDKVSDKEVVLKGGYVTTCDSDVPHYRLSAKEIQFFMNEKIVARHVILYLGNVPVLYVPYFVQPILDVKTKVTVLPGYTKEWGNYVLGSYRYYLSEQMKGYVRLDYRQKKGVGAGIDNNYEAGYLGEGQVRYYYTQENNSLAMDPSGEVDDRYRISYKHKLDFSDDTVGTMELNKLSDVDMVKDYFPMEIDDGWSPQNYVSIVNTKDNYSFEINAEKRLDDFFTTTERLPEAILRVYNQRLWNTKFYYQNEISTTNFIKRYSVQDNMENEAAFRADTYNRLSYVEKLFGFLFATPYVATRQTYYSENRWGDENRVRQIYEYGLDLSTKIFKVFDFKNEEAGINRIRHVITPNVGFRFREQPSIDPSNLHQFDSIDAIARDSSIVLSLENKLQTKRSTGTGYENVDLARFTISTNYYYTFEKGNLGFQDDGRFSDIIYDLELRPFNWMFAKTEITTYVKDWQFKDSVKTANTDIYLNFGEKGNFGLGHRFENSDGGSASQFTTEVNYKINRDWGVRIYERFDAHKKTWEEQEYSVYKDLHCWLGEFTCNFQDGFAFWVIFRLKAFPEVPIGFKRTYRRPTPGAMQ